MPAVARYCWALGGPTWVLIMTYREAFLSCKAAGLFAGQSQLAHPT